ncbi:MAG: hypothetical protein J2P41_15755, partial [Blastocatellia bacterium]|nr:hypothetical protein [Blastocatellia bacterium]
MLSLVHRSTILRLSLFAFLIQAGTCVFAGVNVTQNVGPGATAWPDTPIISTVSDPSAQATVGENFSGGGVTSYSQTF